MYCPHMQLTNATITMVSRLKYIRKCCFICKDKTIIWKFKKKTWTIYHVYVLSGIAKRHCTISM